MFTNHITSTFSAPLFGGGSSGSTLVPYQFPVAVGGLPFELDDKEETEFKLETIRMLRPQSDDGDVVSEKSLNPEALWRRSLDSFHKGAGQTHFDREDSVQSKFLSSKGLDVWTEGQTTLLPTVDEKFDVSDTNLYLALVGGSRVYVANGVDLSYTDDISASSPTFTEAANPPSNDLVSIATDGRNIYACDGADLYGFDGMAGSPDFSSALATDNAYLVRVCNGRVLNAVGEHIYEWDGSSNASHFQHDDANFTWVDFTSGLTAIYAAGTLGDKSYIYKIGIKEDGSGLDVPLITAFLPEGLVVTSLGSYLGFILIGTEEGVIFGLPDASGNLTIGALLRTDSACYAFEGQGESVWFGWDNYDGVSTGLGRLSLRDFAVPDLLAPAYASDLMFTGSGSVQGILTVDGARVFSVDGEGVFRESSDLVESAELETSLIDYALPNQKLALYVDISHETESSGGSHSIRIKADNGAYSLLGSHVLQEDPFLVGELLGNTFSLKLTVNRSGSDNTVGPKIKSLTLRSEARPDIGDHVTLPLILAPEYISGGRKVNRSVIEDYSYIKALRQSKTPIILQVSTLSQTAVVDDLVFDMQIDRTGSKWEINGTCHTRFKVIG